MKAHKSWGYAPYKQPFFETGDIYICRVAPDETEISFDWLSIGDVTYSVYCRARGEGEFTQVGATKECTYLITGLASEQDYEFYVKADGKKSRIRLARCAPVIGTVVNYLHPDDEAYEFYGRYLCSPSMVRHPDGFLLASMDLYEGLAPQNLTLIFRSVDDGKHWHYVSELFPCFWGKMFIYQGELYMTGVATEYGDLLIGKSTDGGKTWSEPTVLLRGSNGKTGHTGVHKNPQPVVEFKGRIWNTLEWGSWGQWYHAAMVMSAPVGCDLLDADNWSFSDPGKYDPSWPGLPEGRSPGNIEGALPVVNGELYNIMRYQMGEMKPNYGYIISYKVDTENPENPLQYDHCIPFPANHSKFEIHYHEGKKKYYSLASRILDSDHAGARNLLSLMVSEDCKHWEVDRDVIDMRNSDPQYVGFQYVDFFFEGDEILYLCRTAMNQAHNFHDANYSTFGRIKL